MGQSGVGMANTLLRFCRASCSVLTRDTDVAIMSFCPPVRPSVRRIPVLSRNGSIYCHSFFITR